MKPLILFVSMLLYSALAFTQDCGPVTITGGNGQINVTGVSAPIAKVQVFNSSWATVSNQMFTNSPGDVVVPLLPAGQYTVNVHFYTAGWVSICEKSAAVTVNTGPPPTVDSCGSTFLKSYGELNMNEEAFKIIKTSDNGYIVVGLAADNGNTDQRALLMKYDSKGTLLWRITKGGVQNDFLSTAVATDDGGCLAGGTANTNGPQTYSGDAWLVRVDGNGIVLWNRRYFLSDSAGDITQIIQTSDGGFAFSGTCPFTPGLSDWMVVKVNSTGGIMWQRKLGTAGSDGGHGLVEDNHGGAGLVACGIVQSGTWYDLVISKLDLTSGTPIWTKGYDLDSKANWVGPMYKAADGFILNARNADGFGIENNKPVIIKTDFNGNITWAKEFSIAGSVKEGRLAVLPDGSIMMAQGELPRSPATDIYLMRIDPAGSLAWSKKYTKPGTQWFYDLITDGNAVMGAGIATTGSYYDVMIGRIDLNGKLGSCQPENVTVATRNCVVTNTNFTWPTHTYLNLDVVNPLNNATRDLLSNTIENVLCASECPTVTVSSDVFFEYAGNAVVRVCIAAPVTRTLVYSYTTTNGSATSGADYAGGSGTVTIPAGQTCATISIPIINDSDAESLEQFTVTVGLTTGTVTISDDDQPHVDCAGTICISNVCPSGTVDLYNAYNIPNLPAGTVVSWHTGTPATDANRMTEQEARNVSVAGTYYAAINISGGNCYSATITVSVTITPCSANTPVTTATLIEKENIVQLKSNDQPTARSIMAFPNPFMHSLRVVIDSEKQEKVTVTLLDVQGVVVKQMPVQLMPGSNSVLMEGLDKFAPGSYFLKISSASGVKTLKVMRQQLGF